MHGLTAKQVHINEQFLHVDLLDGRRISTPLNWYPELLNASIKQLKDYRLICDSTGAEWIRASFKCRVDVTGITRKAVICIEFKKCKLCAIIQ